MTKITKTKHNKNVTKKSKERIPNRFYLLIFGLLLTPVICLLFFNIYFGNRVHPNISVGGIAIGGQTKSEAIKTLENNLTLSKTIQVKVKNQEFNLDLNSFDFSVDFESSVDVAMSTNKSTNHLAKLFDFPKTIFTKANLPIVIKLDTNKLREHLTILASEHTSMPSPYSVELVNNQIIVDKGKPGEIVNIELLENEINNLLTNNAEKKLELKFTPGPEPLNENEVNEIIQKGEKLIGKKMVLEHDFDSFTLSDKILISFLSPDNTDNKKLVAYLNENIIPKVERIPQDASFIFKDQKVEEFSPAKDGITVDTQALAASITNEFANLEALDNKSINIKIPVSKKSPNITLTDVNNLGIRELVGRGVSYFRGSIPSRVFNVGHAAAKFQSVLVPPNETFSFNGILGDVSALTGFKQAYIIKDGRTVLGDGGGVCQVSTTLFRAVLNAGLPIIERRAHSYRVGYYEQESPPGIDATIFYPTTDFKFQNDTPGHLLIQSIYNPKDFSLVFEIYGTKDGRTASVSTPVFLSSAPPPEDLYVDDPTLPSGQVKQIDHKAWGAKISFNYKVERDNEILIDKNFVSNYQPWQSVFLRGTGPI